MIFFYFILGKEVFFLKKSKKYALWTFVLVITLVVQLIVMTTPPNGAIDVEQLETMSYQYFEEDIENENIAVVYFSENSLNVYVKTADGNYYKTANPEYDMFKKELLEDGLVVESAVEFVKSQTKQASWVGMLLFMFNITTAISMALRWWFSAIAERDQSDANLVAAKPNNHIKNNHVKDVKEKDNENVKKFKDIAGLYEVKKDMQCLVDFLKNKDKYVEAGAVLPKGVILYGPPGTGKTLLAKAVAGEAGVPFHYMSGSDFVEMYVGVGAKRVRELFEKAKKDAPCIVFIDEIDAIGGKRGEGDSNGEDRKTINALLTEMDGFTSSENILVIAATNRLEDLDSALVRPGRFTNKFCVPLPETPRERLEIIRLYGKNKKFAEDVDFKGLARETTGFSPASIEALLNESAIISVQDKKQFIDKASIDKAMFKVLLSGHVKENQSERNKEELLLVSWHEAGHALVGRLNGKNIPKVTILSTTSGAGGVTFTTPKSTGLHSVNDLKAEVAELYAGRVAELMLLKDKNQITTGASNDIQKATDIIKGIVTSYGMSDEFGMLNLNQLQVSQSRIIEEEVRLAKEIEEHTVALLTQHYNRLEAIANALMERETLYEQDLDTLIKENKPLKAQFEDMPIFETKNDKAQSKSDIAKPIHYRKNNIQEFIQGLLKKSTIGRKEKRIKNKTL